MENIKDKEYETPDKEFQDAFNSGYTLAKYDPEFLDNLLFDLGDSEKLKTEGLIWGKRQYEDELNIERANEFKRLREKGRDKERDLDRSM